MRILARILVAFVMLLSLRSALGQRTTFYNQNITPNSPAATWTIVQVASKLTCTAASVTTSTCTISPITATTAGNTLLLMSALNMSASGPGTFSAASGDGTWTHCPSQANHEADGAGQSQTDCAYILSATGGATSVSFTWGTLTGAGNVFIDAVLYEIHRSTGTATLETCGAGTATACTTVTSVSPYTGPVPTVTSTDFVGQWNASDPGCTAVASPYNSSPTPIFDQTNVGGSFVGSLSQTSGTAAVYTCPASSPTAMAAIAFK